MSANEDSPTWRSLPLELGDAGLTPLLVSTCFSDSSYTIHLTDMENTWVEALDRRAIIMRGFQEDTSIDPSDGDNMKALLHKLKDGLHPSRVGHSQTSLSLGPYDGKQTGDGGIILTIKYTFPSTTSLQPLVWPIYLKRCPLSTTTTELVLPLVHVHRSQAREIDALMLTVADKDAVIAKLLDKMETMGIGLENVFTSLPAKRKVTREAAALRIKGLAPFKRPEWTSNFHSLVEPPSTNEALIQGVFGGTGVHYQPSVEPGTTAPGNEWWKTIGTITSIPIRNDSGSMTDTAASPSPAMPAEAGDDDDFQVQVTPARFAKSKVPPRRPVANSEDDDDDFQVQSTPPCLESERRHTAVAAPLIKPEDDTSTEDDKPDLSSPPRLTGPRQQRRIGAIGKDAGLKSPSPPPLSPPLEQGNGSETASETEEHPAGSSKEPSPPVARHTRKGLGRIGGKPTKALPQTVEMADEPASQPVSAPASSSQGPRESRSRKLGMIGQRHAAQEASEPDSRGRAQTSGDSSAHQRETSEDRANRRRQELERDIAAKAAAPVKKRRKF